MTRVPWWGPVGAVVLLYADAAGAIVRGDVTLPKTDAGSSVAPGDVVIFVDSLPSQVTRRCRPPARPPRMVQMGQRFSPRVLVAVAGTTVEFHNRDEVYHNVFSVSPAKRFDLGKYPPHAVNQVTFDQPGIVSLYCDIHPGEASWIVVLPHRFFSQPGPKGRFELPPLPAGRYRLHMWHPTLAEVTRPLDVPRRGKVRVALSF